MFSPKKLKVSKKDLKKSIVDTNDRLRAINARMELDIAAGKDKLKHIEADYNSYKRALEDVKEMQIYANNELEGTQFEIAEAQTVVKEALSRLSKLTEESNSLDSENKKLQAKCDKLDKSMSLSKKKKVELDKLTKSLTQIKKEEEDGQRTLELLAIDLTQLENGVESYFNRKKAAESDYRAVKAKIDSERAKADEELKAIKDRMAMATFASGKEMGRLDKAIAARISELQDLDRRIANKNYEFTTIQSKISSVEERVNDAEERIEFAIKKEQEKVNKIKGEFKDWKVEALDEVARMKMKGKIENINKAGLKEVLNG